ncbi:MFS transporter [Paractinoplanes globisporus]|uniref:MFS transporter n=1 Tax=Paractinoplanes globisporus TaxID=113565 RepID=A0ABW6WS81_9ACTN|nr:MFS transporter [Actinoplanes globisporus]
MLRRAVALAMTMFVTVVASIVWAVATPQPAGAAVGGGVLKAPGGACSTEEWQQDFKACVSRLADVSAARAQCLLPPTPSAPDSGLAGWFAERPESSTKPGPQGLYSEYGYAGYSYTTYDLDSGCASTLIDPDYKFETTVANGEFMIATAVIGASNALRERAWDPQSLWGWADPLVDQATKAVYEKVFTVFGTITLAIVGLYLLWRSRQADMGAATTTAGWAILVMVAVTAIAAWPVRSANLADQSLVTSLGVVHDAVGPRPENGAGANCRLGKADACEDQRPPAVRASDTATETMLYRNWLRGILGSADSETAKKYGRALYDARSLSWDEAQRIRDNPETREGVLNGKKTQWEKVAEQVKQEDPEAYEYLQGVNGMDRIGAGFIAVLASIMFAMFDLTASILVLLGFLIFRWAVIAAPILGTVGLLRPASAGIRRLGNAVVAAIFNIAIFGTGAAIYLFAVDLIMNTPSLPGWLQVVLVWLCGVVGWLLLRPYRRITQLGGKDGTRAIASAGSWHRRFFRDMREAAKLEVAEGGGTAEPTMGKNNRTIYADQSRLRPEARLEDPSHAAGGRHELEPARHGGREIVPVQTRPDGSESSHGDASPPPAGDAPHREPAKTTRTRRATTWTEPDVAEQPASYAIYRPETGSTTREPATPRVRSEAK